MNKKDVPKSTVEQVRGIIEEKGPITIENIAREMYECPYCRKVCDSEEEKVAAAFRKLLYDEDAVRVTLDRAVEIKHDS